MTTEVPARVLTAFGADAADARDVQPEPGIQLGPAWDNGVKIGQLVYARAGDNAHWSATVRERLAVEGVRVARPVRSTDGRFTVAGWKATVWVQGSLARRVDETAVVALRLEEALAAETVPPANENRKDIFARAGRAAWAEADERFGAMAPAERVTGHADLLASTIYSGTSVPTVTDLVPFAAPRPPGYSAALVLVDGLIYGVVDDTVLDRFAHIPDIGELLVRAVGYRRHVSALHREATSITRSRIGQVEEMLVSRLSATI